MKIEVRAFDAFGQEIKVGDWVAWRSINGKNGYMRGKVTLLRNTGFYAECDKQDISSSYCYYRNYKVNSYQQVVKLCPGVLAND